MSYKKSNKLRHMHTAVLLRKTHNDIRKVLYSFVVTVQKLSTGNSDRFFACWPMDK